MEVAVLTENFIGEAGEFSRIKGISLEEQRYTFTN